MRARARRLAIELSVLIVLIAMLSTVLVLVSPAARAVARRLVEAPSGAPAASGSAMGGTGTPSGSAVSNSAEPGAAIPRGVAPSGAGSSVAGSSTAVPAEASVGASAAASSASGTPSVAPRQAQVLHRTPTPIHPTGPLRVVGLGDSVEAGTSCDGCTTFVQVVGNRLGALQKRPVQVSNLASNGFTTTDVLAVLGQAGTQADIAASDLVVVEIGANDLDESRAGEQSCAAEPVTSCFGAELATARTNLTTILRRVHALQRRPGAQVVAMGYWDVFADGAVAQQYGSDYVNTSDAVTRSFNVMVDQVSLATGSRFADAYRVFPTNDTAYLAGDGEHPNQSGHLLLAGAVQTSLGATVTTL